MRTSRKGMNFGIVLIIGIVIFIVLGVLAGLSDSYSVGGGSDGTEDEGNLFEKNVGWMGNISTTSRSVLGLSDIDVDPGAPNKTLESFEQFTVKNSIFWGDNSFTTTFEAQKPRSLYVKFTVADADRAGRTIFGFNAGRMIFGLNGNIEKKRGFRPGKTYTVKLSNVSKGQNTLLIAAENPGIMFLDTTFYDMRDAELILNDKAFSKNLNTFRLFPYEVKGFDQGEITFSVNEDVTAQTPLRVDINGNRIVNRRAVKRATPYSEKFSSVEADLRRGENTISFYTRPGSRYKLSNVNVDVDYYATTTRETVRGTFEVSDFDYTFTDSDAEGTITVNVEEIGLEKPMKLTLNNRTYQFSPQNGKNTFSFKGSDLVEGKNTVTLRTTGSYRISDLSVKLED